ncbi:helix-turn-helix domain-containing protein [Streptomyces boncukensis]|uniref:Helix-turn-helix transcriptional regulator n=1 Tax=Streptomyces boncukensis TaxID=2711219 RepID=A0A6G4WQG7_9ACTN|nr:helix-turn-helix transcriptional regulator [Streptomyces boncukensis]
MPKKRASGADLNPGALPLFGEDVKRVRLARGLQQKHLGTGTGYSEGYVSKVESGTIVPAPRFAEGCDRVFGTGDLFARQLRRLIEGEAPSWFAPYMDAEREASEIQEYCIAFVLGLLQTEKYARSVFERGPLPLTREEIEARVTSRLRRREILERPRPPEVWAILHEACLRMRVGSARVMADQLGHILDALQHFPTLTVQVLPYEAAAGAPSTPFTMLEIPESSPVVYVEGPQGGRPYDAKEAMANSRRQMNHLRASALSPQDSLAYVSAIKDDHERNARVDQVELQRQLGGHVRRVGPGARVRRKRARPGQ